KRVEDPRLLRGGGRYLADLELPRALSVAFVRSPHAHARVARIDTVAVRALAGVVDVVTGDELRMVTKPLVPRLEGGGFTPTAAWALSVGVARFCGEAAAVAVAALARRLGRPVRWIEERRENLAAASQARAQRTSVELAAAADGTVLGLRARVVSDNGAYHAYPTTGALEPLGTANILPGP